MLKRGEQRPRIAVLRQQRRGGYHSVAPRAAITLERQTVKLLYDKVGQVNRRMKARELYTVLQILEQVLANVNEG